MTFTRRLVTVVACSWIVFPGSAHSSTVSVSAHDEAVYEAAAGEANRVEVFPDGVIVDPGAVIQAGSGCDAIDAHTVRCRSFRARVDAGDMDDVVIGHDISLNADGGPGDDRLEMLGEAGDVVLLGGGGHDVLLGGSGRDVLSDGDGSEAPDADIMDGREGSAVVSYLYRTDRLVIDLEDPGPDGEKGEQDMLRSIDTVLGGMANDDIRGTQGPDKLRGGPGHDQLHGRAGTDTLDAAGGNDRVFGGSGNDQLIGGWGNDRLAGGADADRLVGDRGTDRLFGDDGPDVLDGGPQRDRLHGGDGSDRLRSGFAFCGSGHDEARAVEHARPDCEILPF